MKLTRTFDLDNTDRKRKIWFMSDLHYNHLNIMKFCGRPFETVEEMNDYILNELSDKISKDDILFDLGDMIWKESQEDVKLLGDLLPSESYKIMGNHDSIGSYQSNQKKYWKVITDLLDIQIIYKGERIKLILSHYPILDWNGKYHGSINLHGHSHGNNDSDNKGILRYDLGFDATLAKKYGSFLMPFEFIWEETKILTSGKSYESWVRELLKEREKK